MTRLLVLDLATNLGFAVGTERGVEDHGSHRLPSTGNDIAAFLKAYRAWLTSAIQRFNPDEVVFEMPIMPSVTNLATLRKLYSLCGLTELIAKDLGCQVSEANLMEIRRHFIGTARAPKEIPKADRRQWMKDRIVSSARARGFRPANDDDADALALFAYAMHCRVPGFVLSGDEIARAA
jgi:Holliday junction resolvasome RuvABC endonuclease subunit